MPSSFPSGASGWLEPAQAAGPTGHGAPGHEQPLLPHCSQYPPPNQAEVVVLPHIPTGKGEGIWGVKACSLLCSPAQTQRAALREGKTSLLVQNKYHAKRDFPTCSPIAVFFCTISM